MAHVNQLLLAERHHDREIISLVRGVICQTTSNFQLGKLRALAQDDALGELPSAALRVLASGIQPSAELRAALWVAAWGPSEHRAAKWAATIRYRDWQGVEGILVQAISNSMGERLL